MRNTSLAGLAPVLLALLVPNAHAADEALATDEQKFSYVVGAGVARDLIGQGISVDAKAFALAIEDAMADREPRMTVEEMREVVTKAQEKAEAEAQQAASANRAKGDAFRTEYAAKQGVTSLPNGILYTVLASGEGPSPTAESTVEVHYVGRFTDGREFDSSVARGQPAQFPLNGVIKGWTETLPLMKVGDKWEVVIPPELGYGSAGAGGAIGPDETLVFEIELLKIL